MLRFIYADELKDKKLLEKTMFQDRAKQFKERLNWNVTVDQRGWETDEYDEINPLYIIWENSDGRHAGSMRALPTTGRTMINDHFLHLTDGVIISSPLIWECTRFCLAPGASPVVAAGLLLGCLEAAVRFGVDQAVGVFDARMPRIYGRIGHSPEVIGTSGSGRDAISVGIWTVQIEIRDKICKKFNIPQWELARWFDQSFNPVVSRELVAA